jgi:hypothetical protein
MSSLSSRLFSGTEPIYYHVWLELPFPLAVRVNKRFQADYKSFVTEVEMVISSNIYKVVTGSFWQQSREVSKWADRIQADKHEPPPSYSWIVKYVDKSSIHDFVKELEQREDTHYVHVEEVPSIVHVTTPIPQELVMTADSNTFELLPQISFLNEQVLPVLQEIVDAYRISVYPMMRYGIPPVSEALVDLALIHFTDKEDTIIGSIYYGFDVRTSRIIHENSTIQERFDQFLPLISTLQAENQMSSAYYLYRMRRWAEAITLASAVVDNLLKDIVFKIASTEIEAEAIWLAYGRKYKDLFNEVFPKLGKPKLSTTNKPLWDNFIEAKKDRSSKTHGSFSNPFDKKEAEETKRYLGAFHDVAAWLTQQMGHTWNLECSDENGNRLESFP